MQRIVSAALLYFALVFGAGFVLGLVRVPLLVPRIGARWAELAEMPIMALVIFHSSGHVLRRFPAVNHPRKALLAGLLALGLLVGAELAFAAALQGQSPLAYIRSRDSVSGSVYLGLLVMFALMPWLRLDGHA